MSFFDRVEAATQNILLNFASASCYVAAKTANAKRKWFAVHSVRIWCINVISIEIIFSVGNPKNRRKIEKINNELTRMMCTGNWMVLLKFRNVCAAVMKKGVFYLHNINRVCWELRWHTIARRSFYPHSALCCVVFCVFLLFVAPNRKSIIKWIYAVNPISSS